MIAEVVVELIGVELAEKWQNLGREPFWLAIFIEKLGYNMWSEILWYAAWNSMKELVFGFLFGLFVSVIVGGMIIFGLRDLTKELQTI